ncbi:MAG: cupin fold metalloprotein, WbuC family [Burkholderiaceae bacterium]|nr:MAG: cupin fold metalloprotein, WbuC family [Burkholderiaceae bacterium]
MNAPIILDQPLLDRLGEQARQSPRLRAHLNLHDRADAPCHRLLVAIEPGSYVAPHRHVEHDKAESFVVIRGSLGLIVFTEHGQIHSAHRLDACGTCLGVHIPCNTFHTIFALTSGTVFFESKAGPYAPIGEADFAPWAPREGAEACAAQLAQWHTCLPATAV